MAKYKIKKENLNEFWGLFGKKKPQSLQQIIDNDPVLNKLDDELADINKTYLPKLKKMQKEDPTAFDSLVKMGLINLSDFNKL